MVKEEELGLQVVDPVTFSIGKTVRKLMEENNLSEADLCRGVNLPQTTINRLLSGQTNDPRISTLTAIAQFFKVTIEQLLGVEPLITSHIGSVKRGQDLPILSWEQVENWLEAFPSIEAIANNHTTEWVKTEKPFVRGSFAVWTQPSMEAFFGRKSLLLVDTEVRDNPNSSLEDGCIVFTVLDKKSIALRQVVKEGKEVFLKRLFAPYEMFLLENLSAIKGIVIEGRQHWAKSR